MKEKEYRIENTDNLPSKYVGMIIKAKRVDSAERMVLHMLKKDGVKELPKFKNEDEERDFWATHDSTDYFDWSKAKRVIFPNLQLTKKPISLRITNSLLAKVKAIANKKDMPYQTLMKQYVSKGVEQEFAR